MKEKVLEIVRQLTEDPKSLPRVYLPPDPSLTASTGTSTADEKVNMIRLLQDYITDMSRVQVFLL